MLLRISPHLADAFVSAWAGVTLTLVSRSRLVRSIGSSSLAASFSSRLSRCTFSWRWCLGLRRIPPSAPSCRSLSEERSNIHGTKQRGCWCCERSIDISIYSSTVFHFVFRLCHTGKFRRIRVMDPTNLLPSCRPNRNEALSRSHTRSTRARQCQCCRHHGTMISPEFLQYTSVDFGVRKLTVVAVVLISKTALKLP